MVVLKYLLAVNLIVSSRGVLFLKSQNITQDQMTTFLQRFHTIAGAPASSGLHIHPSINVNGGSSEGLKIQKISSENQRKGGCGPFLGKREG